MIDLCSQIFCIRYPEVNGQALYCMSLYVLKSDGSIRVCGDYKAINECIEDDVYKLPNVKDMFAMLSQDLRMELTLISFQ